MATRRRHSAEFKAKVALEAVRGERTMNEIAAAHELHPMQVQQWKRQLMEGSSRVFATARETAAAAADAAQTAQLYEEIGRLKMDLDWLKKKAARFST